MPSGDDESLPCLQKANDGKKGPEGPFFPGSLPKA